jgi:hypothetical protein
MPSDSPDTGTETAPDLGRYNGLTAAEHAARRGVDIGRPGSGRHNKIWVREVDTVAEIERIYQALSPGGQVARTSDGLTVLLLPDGTYVTYRATSSTPPHDPAVDINAGGFRPVRVHTPRQEGG